MIDTIKIIRSGKVRRAKLYYLRERTGKSARIAEKIRKKIGIDIEAKPETVNEDNVVQATIESEPKGNEALKAEVEKKENIKTEAKELETTKVDVQKDAIKTEKKLETTPEKK